uniref:Uncharacterized protein n=1 Tax=Rhizophora mucronata TaxID=61149 RepID=A0A2P2IXL9_RHIMU
MDEIRGCLLLSFHFYYFLCLKFFQFNRLHRFF